MTTTGTGYSPHLYTDIAALIAGGIHTPTPTVGLRTDKIGLLYPGAVNVFFGPPESGKTLAASAIAADSLFLEERLLVIDIDHNGPAATVARFQSFGIPTTTLSDPTRFRYAAPEDPQEMLAVVIEAGVWKPDLVILDSIGELLPMFGANSNDADQFTAVNSQVTAALARTGATVLAIDHEAKNPTSSAMGAGGTIAKKRAVDGSMLRFAVTQPFTPGHGGAAHLTITKDRHGGLREASPIGDREPLAATFRLTQTGDAITWKFLAPAGHVPRDTTGTDADELDKLTPPPRTVRDVKGRMRWSSERATNAMQAYRERSSKRSSDPPPFPVPQEHGTPGTDNPTTP